MSTITDPSAAAVADRPADIERRLRRLRWWNLGVGAALAVQAALIAALTNGFSLPVTSTFMDGPPGTAAKLRHLFDLPTGWGVVAFLAISAGALWIIASPPVFGWYKAQSAARPQLRPLDRVLLQLLDHDRADRVSSSASATSPRCWRSSA